MLFNLEHFQTQFERISKQLVNLVSWLEEERVYERRNLSKSERDFRFISLPPRKETLSVTWRQGRWRPPRGHKHVYRLACRPYTEH